ncbi:MAG: sulfite exporter TauE/SafE family protein [Calditrichaceae bacterium]|nr:sulfite exporter TauE/SafE family protein [Calditrichaceae bacterium]
MTPEFSLVCLDILLAIVIVAFGSVIQGSVGFGLGPFAVPLLFLINPLFVPGPLILAALLLTLLMFFRERADVDFKGLKWAIVGRIVGTLIGAFVLTIISGSQMVVLLAGLVILAVIINASGLKVKAVSWTIFSAGTLSGFMAIVAAIGGAPMALIYQDEAGPKIRSTLSAIFVIGIILALISLVVIGKFGLTEFFASLWMMPGIVIGFLISSRTKKYLDRGYIRTAVLTVSALAAVILVIRYFYL